MNERVAPRTASALLVLAVAAVVAACNPAGSSPSAAAPTTGTEASAAAPSAAESASAPESGSAGASMSASAGASGDQAYVNQQLRPAIGDLVDALTGWGEAFMARASATGGSPNPSAAADYQAAVQKLQTALSKAQTAVNGQAPACASDAQDKAKSFVDFVQTGTKDLLNTTPTASQLGTVSTLLAEGVRRGAEVTTAISGACA